MMTRSALRADSAVVLGPRRRRETRFTHFVRSAQTVPASQKWKRALRARPPRACAPRRAINRPPRVPPTAQQRSWCFSRNTTVHRAKPGAGVRRQRHMRRRAAQSAWPRARSARFVFWLAETVWAERPQGVERVSRRAMRSSSAGNPSRSEGLPHSSAGAYPPAALPRSVRASSAIPTRTP